MQTIGAPEDLQTPRPLPARSPAPERVTAVAATADLRRSAVAVTAPWFRSAAEVLLLTEAGAVRLDVPGRRQVIDLAFDADGRTLTAMDDGNGVLRWEESGAPDEPWRPWRGAVPGGGGSDGPRLAQAAVSADGRLFAFSSSFSQNAVVRDATTGGVVHNVNELFGHLAYEERPSAEGSVALSADGTRLAYAERSRWSQEGRVFVQDVGADTYTAYRTGVKWVNGLAFAPDAAALAVVGARPDETVAAVVRVDSPAERTAPVVLPTDERVDRVNLRPVWCGAEPLLPVVARGDVTVWNLTTASVLLSVPAPGPCAAAALTPDGRTLLVAAPDTGIHAHPLPVP